MVSSFDTHSSLLQIPAHQLSRKARYEPFRHSSKAAEGPPKNYKTFIVHWDSMRGKLMLTASVRCLCLRKPISWGLLRRSPQVGAQRIPRDNGRGDTFMSYILKRLRMVRLPDHIAFVFRRGSCFLRFISDGSNRTIAKRRCYHDGSCLSALCLSKKSLSMKLYRLF